MGRDATELGDRIPGVWVTPDKKLVVSSAIDGKVANQKEHEGLKDGEWNKVEISQRLKDGKVVMILMQNDYGFAFSICLKCLSMERRIGQTQILHQTCMAMSRFLLETPGILQWMGK